MIYVFIVNNIIILAELRPPLIYAIQFYIINYAFRKTCIIFTLL